MRAIGLACIAFGFIGGALSAVVQEEGVPWAWFTPVFLLGCAGVLLVRLDMRRRATDEGRLEASFQELDARLKGIAERVAALDDEKDDIEVYDLPARIDEDLPQDIIAFAEERESIAHARGAQVYADVMSHFAAGERYLYRVWSCSADGYIDEAHDYLARSRKQFSRALEIFEQSAGQGR